MNSHGSYLQPPLGIYGLKGKKNIVFTFLTSRATVSWYTFTDIGLNALPTVFAIRSAQSCVKKSTEIFKSLICGNELPQAKSKCHTHRPDSYNQHSQACICKYWVPHTPYFCHMFVYILLKGSEENKERNKENESGISAQLRLA